MRREEEGSNQPELGAFFLALRDTLIEEPLLYLRDNQMMMIAFIITLEEIM